jgi:hypothetical protein
MFSHVVVGTNDLKKALRRRNSWVVSHYRSGFLIYVLRRRRLIHRACLWASRRAFHWHTGGLSTGAKHSVGKPC